MTKIALKWRQFYVLALATTVVPLANADESASTFRFRGNIKSYAVGSLTPDIEGLPSEGQSSRELLQWLGSIRLGADGNLSETLSGEVAYQFEPTWRNVPTGEQTLSFTSATTASGRASYRLVDLDEEIADSASKWALLQNLDRLNLRWSSQTVDLTVGRQAVTFGSARVIQPTDVLLPYSFQRLNTEYRVGVDAVRAQISVSQLGEVDLGAVSGDGARAHESAVFARAKNTFGSTDLTAIGMYFQGAGLLGGGVQRGIWDLGFFLDFAQVFGEVTNSYFRLSTGADYVFASGFGLTFEYHFNGAGYSNSSDYLASLESFAYRKGGVFLLGRHYLISGLSWPATPLLGLSGQVFLNANDGSVFLSPGAEYSLTENLYIDGGLFVTVGNGPSLSPLGTLTLRSEFGAYPLLAFGAIRYYF